MCRACSDRPGLHWMAGGSTACPAALREEGALLIASITGAPVQTRDPKSCCWEQGTHSHSQPASSTSISAGAKHLLGKYEHSRW